MIPDDEDDAIYQIIESMIEKEERRMSTSNDSALVGTGATNPAVHMKLKVKGSPEKIVFFHYLMTQIDPDWPYTDQRRNPQLKAYCPECKGMIYRNPEYSPEEIKIIAQQIDGHLRLRGGLNVKVKMFTRLPNCKDVSASADIQDRSEGSEVVN